MLGLNAAERDVPLGNDVYDTLGATSWFIIASLEFENVAFKTRFEFEISFNAPTFFRFFLLRVTVIQSLESEASLINLPKQP